MRSKRLCRPRGRLAKGTENSDETVYELFEELTGLSLSAPPATKCRTQKLTLIGTCSARKAMFPPTGVMPGTAFEADEWYQNAGKTKHAPSGPANPPRQWANTRSEHGTYANDRPPIIRVISRETGGPRWWVCDHACGEHVALYGCMAEIPGASPSPCDGPPWLACVGAG
jgi:hypothetical protein